MNQELIFALCAFRDYLKENGIAFNLRLDAEVNIPLSADKYDWVNRVSVDAKFHYARRGDLLQYEGLEEVSYGSEETLCKFYLVKDDKRTEEYWIADLDDAIKYIPDFKKYIDAAKAHLEQKVRDRFKKNMEKKQNEIADLQKVDPLFGSW